MATLRIEGEEEFPSPAAEVIAKLTDAVFLAGCVPDVIVIEATRDRSLLHLPPGVTMLPGRLEIELIVMTREPHQATYRIINRATGASGTAEVQLRVLEGSDSHTRIAWFAEVVKVTGLLRMMPGSVIRSGVERAAPRVWSRIRESM